jgi:hypothetical protein
MRSALALDTVETWDPGAGDAELYLGFDGIGAGSDSRELSGELVAGVGIFERFSAYLVARFAAQDFSEGVGGVSVGIFGTPLDTDHIDLDFFFDLASGGPGFSQLQFGPALELNIDLRPDLERWGIYLMVGVPMLRAITGGHDAEGERAFSVSVEATFGTYLTLGRRHQLLMDFQLAFHPGLGTEELVVEVGGLGLGYNVLVHEAVELIVEGRFDIPQRDEPFAVGVMAGVIATIPSSRSRSDRDEFVAKDGD